MKLVLLIMVSITLIGCYQKVNHVEIRKAEQFCGSGGIDYIRENFAGNTAIYCLDGSSEFDVNIKLASN